MCTVLYVLYCTVLYCTTYDGREHRGGVSSCQVAGDCSMGLTSSSDGAAIVWQVASDTGCSCKLLYCYISTQLPSMTRLHLLRASSGLLGGRLHPNTVS